MNEKTIRALVEAGAVKKVKLIANGATIHADIFTQNGPVTATTHRGTIKTWVTIDASAKWVKGLGLGEVHLMIGDWMPGQKSLQL